MVRNSAGHNPSLVRVGPAPDRDAEPGRGHLIAIRAASLTYDI
jgi:hypothetical protein